MSSMAARNDTAPLSVTVEAPPAGRPIDLVHLSQQSLGDKNLEIELLGLFERQAETILARLAQPLSGTDRRWQMDLCHTLKGSARAVGASRVAFAAQTHETVIGEGGGEGHIAISRGILEEAVREAQGVIRALIANG